MSKNEETMSKQEIEQYFIALKEDVDNLRDDVNKHFEKLESTMKIILNIVQSYDQERKEVKSSLWELERRILNLEKVSA